MEKLLSYENFIEYCVKNITTVLKNEYEIKSNKVYKTDEWVVDSFSVEKKNDDSAVKTIYELHTQQFYHDYADGQPLGEVILSLLKEIEREFGEKIKMNIDLTRISEYDYIKDKLIIRAISYTDNKKLLNDHYYRKTEDVALVLYMEEGQSKKGYATVKMPVGSMKNWDMEKAFEAAMDNTVQKNTPVFYPMELLFAGDTISPRKKYLMDKENYRFKASVLNSYRLSTEASINGAIAVFFPGVLERVAEILDDDFYIVFLSIHEGMVHSMKLSKKSDLLERARDTKGMNMSVAEYLSNTLFVYRRDKKVLEKCK